MTALGSQLLAVWEIAAWQGKAAGRGWSRLDLSNAAFWTSYLGLLVAFFIQVPLHSYEGGFAQDNQSAGFELLQLLSSNILEYATFALMVWIVCRVWAGNFDKMKKIIICVNWIIPVLYIIQYILTAIYYSYGSDRTIIYYIVMVLAAFVLLGFIVTMVRIFREAMNTNWLIAFVCSAISFSVSTIAGGLF